MTVVEFEQIYKEVRTGQYQQRLRNPSVKSQEWVAKYREWQVLAEQILK